MNFLRCTKNEESWNSENFSIHEELKCTRFPKIRSKISFLIFAEFHRTNKKKLCFLYIDVPWVSNFVREKEFHHNTIIMVWWWWEVNQHDKMVEIDANNDSNQYFIRRSMTIDFDQFFMFKMFGDPLVLFGDPQKNCLVTALTSLVTPNGCHQWSPKKYHAFQ